MDPKTNFFGQADGSYNYSLCSHSNNFYIKYVFKINWRPGSTPPPLPLIWQPPGVFLVLSVSSWFYLCLTPHCIHTGLLPSTSSISSSALSHLRIHRHILNKKIPISFLCVCVFRFQHQPKRERRGKHRGKRSSQTKLAGRLHLRRYVFWSSASPSFRVERGNTFLITHTL